MKRPPEDEEEQVRSVASKNAESILIARQRAEDELIRAKKALELKTAELVRSLSMMRATLESTTDGILVTDSSGIVTDYNENYVRMFRIPREILDRRDGVRVQDFIWLVDEVKREEYRTRIEAIRASEPPETFDVLELADGRVFERVSKTQLVDGRNMGRVWSFRDVTERKQAEREHAYLAAIIASSSDAIVSKTLDGIITSWNAGAERILGYTAEEVIGRPITVIIPAERLGEEPEFLDRLRRGERIDHFETVRVRKDGRRINVSLTISPVRDSTGRIIGASKIVRDVTEREQLFALERAARAQAEEASRLKDDFLATVSHELRTPLSAILGWAHMLSSDKLPEDKVRHASEVIVRNARAQAQVIDDLLDVSRIITGKMRLDISPFMPASAIETALESVRPMAEAKGVRLLDLLDPNAGPVSGDAGRLQQIVWNLLSNAIKFTPKGGRVEVRLERINSHIEITVSDTGDGISPEFLPYVFDRFRQADASSARTSGGLGLGLAIVRHLVELHGGVVKVESPGIGKGAVFTVRLPLRPVTARKDAEPRLHPRAMTTETSQPPNGVPDLMGIRVLVVDDESDTREILREVLEQCGADVREADSTSRALEVFKEWRPGVIVSDVGMPGEDGYALIRKIREWEKESGAWTPAVALTAYARSEDRQKALMAGYQVHVAKPIEPVELALVVAGIAHR